MKIYCIRHGSAEPSGELMRGGEVQMIRAGALLGALGLSEETIAIFTSPLPRAKKSADIIAETAHLGPPRVVDWLAEKAVVADLFVALMPVLSRGGYQAIVLVSHQPLLEDLLEAYVEGVKVMPGDVWEIDVVAMEARRIISQ